ncbi:MAG: antibiotic biosynthesis monooxygenase [Hyphomicrobiales bacterium]|nr:antibiotic biosynthesis monooxygenase [Hyphomicrobiales bacterium]
MQLVLLVEFLVRPGFAERFGELVRANARTSIEQEDGCQRFDVLVEPQESRRFILYEIYDDEAAFDLHLHSPHYHSFATAIDGQIEERSIRKLGFYAAPDKRREIDRQSS